MKTLWKRRFCLMLALLLLAAAPALADERTQDTLYFGGTGQETVYAATPLPNGCLLLNGSTQLGRSGQAQLPFATGERRAWLLCLNPDGSIAWEVTDGAKGTTRYVAPQVLSDGRIAVLYYNDPSQVTTQAAIRYFTQEGRPAGEAPLPLDTDLFSLPGGQAGDGFIFSIYEGNAAYVDEHGVTPFTIDRSTTVIGGGKDAIGLPDGQIVCGSVRSGTERRAAVARMDCAGRELWRFSPDEYAEGRFYRPVSQEDGSALVLWRDTTVPSEATTVQRLLCLSDSGELLWELPVPDGADNTFAVTDEGYVFCRAWEEKTYLHIQFFLTDQNGQVLETRAAKPRREHIYGGDLFAWNGEAWFLYNPERAANRTNDRQDSLELADAALVRVKDCEAAGS